MGAYLNNDSALSTNSAHTTVEMNTYFCIDFVVSFCPSRDYLTYLTANKVMSIHALFLFCFASIKSFSPKEMTSTYVLICL